MPKEGYDKAESSSSSEDNKANALDLCGAIAAMPSYGDRKVTITVTYEHKETASVTITQRDADHIVRNATRHHRHRTKR